MRLWHLGYLGIGDGYITIPQYLVQRLDRLRLGLASRKSIVPGRLEMIAEVKFFGRYQRGWIRGGALFALRR